MQKLISFNVNGLRAILAKTFIDDMREIDADIICLQETKMQEGQAVVPLVDYHQYFNYAVKKGYSGTAVFTKIEPLSVKVGLDDPKFDDEGRVLTLEFEQYFLVCCYTPNSQDELKRLQYRVEWETYFRQYLVSLDEIKPVVLCGDLNVAHQEIDLKNPKTNRRNPGFTDEERGEFSKLLDAGFVDSFRFMQPETVKYSWWSYRFSARAKNTGWRIDYFVVSDKLKSKIVSAEILNDVYGSDHCPVLLELDLENNK